MKQVLRIDISYIFDALDEDAVWTGSRQFEKTQKEIISQLGGEEQLLSKEIVSDNYARYIVHVMPKNSKPMIEEPRLEGAKIEPKKQENKKKLRKGGKLLPKVEDKKRRFSNKKGRRLPQRKNQKIKLGGRR